MKKLAALASLSGILAWILLAPARAPAPRVWLAAPASEKAAALPVEESVRASSRKPAANASPQGSRAEFFRASRGEWSVSLDAAGNVVSLSGAAYGTGQPEPASAGRAFLERYAPALFGVSAEGLAASRQRTNGNAVQVDYEQRVNQLPVIGAKVSLLIDAEGSVLYANSSAHPGPYPTNIPRVAPLKVAGALREALSRRGLNLNDSAYEATALASRLELVYLKTGLSIGLVYKADLPLPPPEFGTLDATIDAQSNIVVKLRPTARRL